MLAKTPALDEGPYALSRLESAYLEAARSAGDRSIDVESLMGEHWFHRHHIDSPSANWRSLQFNLASLHISGNFKRPGLRGLRAVKKWMDRILGPLVS